MRQLGHLMFGLGALALTSACATTPVMPAPSVVFPKPVADVQQAAVNALVILGIDVTRNELLHVGGYRRWRMGWGRSTGGETLGIQLEPLAPSRTRVRIDTVYGGGGQTDWTGPVLREMTRILGEWE
jgi:hypothetical protein